MGTQYLRKVGTNEFFVYTARLAKRKDMALHEGPLPSADASKQENTKNPEPPGNQGGLDPNKITMIAEAIKRLDDDGFSKNGKPKIDALSALLEIEITGAERDAAYEEWLNAK